MKCLLITTVLVLFFCQLGNALKCYKCDDYEDKCEHSEDCAAGFDACIVMEDTSDRGGRSSECWKSSECNRKFLKEQFKTDKFKHRCCKKNLCNTCPILAGSKMVLGVTSLLTVIWMLWK